MPLLVSVHLRIIALSPATLSGWCAVMPWIHIIVGTGAGQRHELLAERTTIGRDPSNPIQIADPKSSRVHAALVVDGGRYHVHDLDSSNGTWQGDGRITSMPLVHGSEFRIGATQFRFESISPNATTWSDPAHLQGLDQAKTVLFTPALDGDTQALARANSYLVLLHHLIRRSNAATDRESLFELLDDAAAEALEGDRCAVFLPTTTSDGDGWSLWPPHERRLRARFGAVPFARTLLAAVRRGGEALRCTNDGDLAPSASMVQSGVQSAMAAPVRMGDDIHALLYVDRLVGGQAFTRTDLEFLVAVANQMAVRLSARATVEALRAEVDRLQTAVPKSLPALSPIIGNDPAMVQLRDQVERLAAVTSPVLILGESGSGKELLARHIHARSSRQSRPFHVITCASLAEQGAESVLFGRAQTHGATSPGTFELADGGTVYMDELTELPITIQSRIVRLLETGEVQRPGEATLRRVDVRVIAASAKNLSQALASGEIRAELFHGLEGRQLVMPALRQRAGDIDALAVYFLACQAEQHHQPAKRLSPEAKALLLRHTWPGNIRQLRQIIEQAWALSSERIIQVADLPNIMRDPAPLTMDTQTNSLAAVERAHILRILDHCDGNKKAAAELLEIDRSTLYAKLKQYGVV
jgi:DNA-binding NtrC family response regulator/pSer/pThr/pTyr-binding forkhead associated (FHA) protein